MAIEAITLTPQPHELGLTPNPFQPKIREIPEHLTRRALQEKTKIDGINPETLWAERASAVEDKVHDVISTQIDIVSEVATNSRKDADGPDLHVFFRPGFPIADAWIEVKSSTLTLNQYKDKIKNGLPAEKRNMLEVHKWMTERRIILINGGESNGHEKTKDEILADSFYPQLERIKLFEASKGGE